MKKKLRIGVILGGSSAERDVSLLSGREVIRHLDRRKYRVKPYDPATRLRVLFDDGRKGKIDLAFIALHGPGGEDGAIQGFLDTIGVPYTGSGVFASAVAMDKAAFKHILASQGIAVPRHVTAEATEWRASPAALVRRVERQFGWPKVVKPNTQGSSLGVTIAHGRTELTRGLLNAFRFDHRVIVEEYLGKDEYTVATIGNDRPSALPVIAIVPTRAEFFSYETKYDGSTQEVCPAPISADLTRKLQRISQAVHRLIGARGMLRTDFLVRRGIPYVVETNTIPGLTAESLVPKAARAAGWTFSRLLEELIRLAQRR